MPEAGERPLLTRRATTLASLASATALLTLKLGVGIAAGSLGLISSGVESSGDVLAALMTLFAVGLGARPADADHPYGHRRAENLGALGEATILLIGGVLVSADAIRRLSETGGRVTVHWYELAVLGVALALEAGRMGLSLLAARRQDSPTLRSNATHAVADMAGSLAVLAGLLAVRAGVQDGDSIAALVVAVIILLTAVRLVGENANVLMDRAPVPAQRAAERAIAALGGDIELDRLRLRESAGRYFADVVVSVPAAQALVESHQAADLVEGALERALPGSDVVVHVEPRRRGLDLRDRVLAIALAEPLVKEAHDITIFERPGGASVSLHLKFPAELDLGDAHETAERVEQAIRARPGVADVQTHLEPLERPLSARSGSAVAEGPMVEAIVLELTGKPPRSLRLLDTDAGHVLFLTLAVGAGESLSEAHRLASELEERLHQRIDGLAEVVVHTEP